jgi:hypothetical protein
MVYSDGYWGYPVAKAWPLLRRDLGKGQVLVQFVGRPYEFKEVNANTQQLYVWWYHIQRRSTR